MKKELKVSAIKEGTVIDHIFPGKAFEVAKILNLEDYNETVTIAMNVFGKKGKKDVIKIENRELSEREVNKISLVSPNATVNIIKDYEVFEKRNVEIPKVVEGILACSNMNCVTRREDVKTKFLLESEDPLKLRCHFCDRILDEKDIAKGLMV